MGRKRQSFFYFKELTNFDQFAVFAYAILTIIMLLVMFLGRNDAKLFAMIMCAVVPQLSIYLFLYASLRNMTSYVIWFGFGLLHVVLYFLFKYASILPSEDRDGSIIFLNTIILLWLFQILRYLSFKMQKREFVSPAKAHPKDLFDERSATGTDYFIFVVYWGTFMGLTFLALSH